MSSVSRALILSCALAALASASALAATEPSAPKHDGASTTETLQEVTVTAERAQLAKRVQKFVAHIAQQENGDDGLPLWTQGVCPSVSGMTRQQGEFVLWRISQIASRANIPLAGEQCSPNLFVLLTTKPEKLLRAMQRRNPVFTFGYRQQGNAHSGNAPIGLVNRFISTPRAVRVWYDTDWRDAWGMALGCTLYGVCYTSHAEATRVQANTVYRFSRVFEIVDLSKLHGVSLGQLSDYVAMEGLAKLNPDVRLEDSKTILSLFSEAPDVAPAGITDWDQAFLKSLYTTDQQVAHQRRQVANTMLRQLEH